MQINFIVYLHKFCVDLISYIYTFNKSLFIDIKTGNGPSGISLSYMLSGHWPYWIPEKTDKHPDELLRARLRHADGTKSLVEQDLYELADGIEGRSTNPVSLLVCHAELTYIKYIVL